MSRKIVVIRHGKAEGHAALDLDRVLSPRGREDSTRLGAWLGSRDLGAQDLGSRARVYVSAAARAKQTWDRVSPGLADLDVEVDVTDRLYDAGTDVVLELVAQTSEDVSTVFIVGHNPTMADLVRALPNDGSPARDAFARRGFPTAACAIVECRAWHDPRGVISAFVTPDDY